MYLIRNPETHRWLSTRRGAYETEHPLQAACKYSSQGAALQTVRRLVADHKMRNAKYASGEWEAHEGYKPSPEHYEVVAFRLEEVGVVASV